MNVGHPPLEEMTVLVPVAEVLKAEEELRRLGFQ